MAQRHTDGRMRDCIACLRQAGARFLAHEGFMLAGHIAFVGILSLFPFLIFLIALLGFFGATEAGTYFAAFVFENMLDAVSETIETPLIQMFQDTYGNVLTFSMIGALWAAGTGIEGVRTAVNRAYRDAGEPPVRRLPYWRRRGQSLLLVLVFSGTLLAGLLFAPYVWFLIEELFALGEDFTPPWTAIRYTFSGVLFLAATCTLYRWLPDRRPSWRGTLPGAVLVFAGSVAFSQLFSLFIDHFDTYASVYGSLSGGILSLLFFYYLSVIFIFGAEVNAVADGMMRARHGDTKD